MIRYRHGVAVVTMAFDRTMCNVQEHKSSWLQVDKARAEMKAPETGRVSDEAWPTLFRAPFQKGAINVASWGGRGPRRTSGIYFQNLRRLEGCGKEKQGWGKGVCWDMLGLQLGIAIPWHDLVSC